VTASVRGSVFVAALWQIKLLNPPLQTFHVLGDDVPDDVNRIPQQTFKQAIGLGKFEERAQGDGSGPPSFMLIPSPAFQVQ
jgi:hypothetical protein